MAALHELLWRAVSLFAPFPAGEPRHELLWRNGDHPDEDFLLAFNRLPIELPARFDAELATYLRRDGDPVFLGNGGSHGEIIFPWKSARQGSAVGHWRGPEFYRGELARSPPSLLRSATWESGGT
jgi:hypothetical protein